MSAARVTPLLRSVVRVSGACVASLAEARALRCDAVLIDLCGGGAAARAAARDALQSAGWGVRRRVLALSSLSSIELSEDIALAASLAAAGAVHAVLVARATARGELEHASALLADAGAPDGLRLWAGVSTPRGVLHAGRVAAAVEGGLANGPALPLSALALDAEAVGRAARRREGDASRGAADADARAVVLAARAYGLAALGDVPARSRAPAGDAASADAARDAALAALAGAGFDGAIIRHERGRADDTQRAAAAADAALAPAAAVVAAARATAAAWAARAPGAATAEDARTGEAVEAWEAAEALGVLERAETAEASARVQQ